MKQAYCYVVVACNVLGWRNGEICKQPIVCQTVEEAYAKAGYMLTAWENDGRAIDADRTTRASREEVQEAIDLYEVAVVGEVQGKGCLYDLRQAVIWRIWLTAKQLNKLD